MCPKAADISCEWDSCLTQNTMKSRKWDICSAKEEKSNEFESRFQTTKITCELDLGSQKAEIPRMGLMLKTRENAMNGTHAPKKVEKLPGIQLPKTIFLVHLTTF